MSVCINVDDLEISIVVLTGNENYHLWAPGVQGVAMCGVFWSALKGTNDPRVGSSDAREQRSIQREMQALCLITRTVNPAIALEIQLMPDVTETNSTTRRPNAKEIWDHLKSRYEKSDTRTSLRYFEQLVRTKLVDDGTLEAQLNKFSELRIRCIVNDFKFLDFQFASILLTSLPESYSHLPECLLANRGVQDLTCSGVQEAILQTERLRKDSAERDANANSHTTQPSSPKKGPKGTCFKCGKKGHYANRCRSKT